MLTIRLARAGAKKRPFFHITVADSRKPRDGRFVERIGYFNPIAKGKEVRLEINQERVDFWIGKGAKASNRVLNLFRENIETPEEKTKREEKKEKKRLIKISKKEKQKIVKEPDEQASEAKEREEVPKAEEPKPEEPKAEEPTAEAEVTEEPKAETEEEEGSEEDADQDSLKK